MLQKDNIEIFSHSTSTDIPIYMISDIEGNVIILNAWGDIVLLNPDGSTKRVLLDKNNKEAGIKIRSMCFSDDNNTLLVAGYTGQEQQMLLYLLQYSK